ncbi:MAG: hypothetical protein GC159_16960 [Phycisphaera sp.]|nr:hypothetical protein [Phycisphaera sp.]
MAFPVLNAGFALFFRGIVTWPVFGLLVVARGFCTLLRLIRTPADRFGVVFVVDLQVVGGSDFDVVPDPAGDYVYRVV